jgi:ABC-2 type transport system ATP-binding protein
MLQQGGIDPRMRPLETLRLHARFFRRPHDPTRLLERVGLATVASTPYRRLSGGERQRLSLALALVGEPEVLVLDEPTAGMDPEAKASTRELVAGIRDAGAAVLLTTHELADVERLADRIVVIAGGRIAAVGRPTELMAGGGAHLRFRLTSELTEPDVESLARRLGAPVLVQGEGRYRLEAPAADPGTIAALATWCAERGLSIVDLRSGGQTLEERYLELVRGATDG